MNFEVIVMYKEMRKKNRQRSEAEAYEFLNRAEWGVLSLCAEGLPYGVPVCHALVGKTLYIHCALEGQKLDFIRANPTGCFTAVASFQAVRSEGSALYESTIALGSVRIVEDAAERLAGFDAINEKYTDGFELGRSFVQKWGARAAVVALDIEHITAKSAGKE
jgi:nitroimidazol reductase NimA-like FMN-containing flavoprotein (pyridoxamine 5'-phosphate oxidase superfamily)